MWAGSSPTITRCPDAVSAAVVVAIADGMSVLLLRSIPNVGRKQPNDHSLQRKLVLALLDES
jgi:hypothetical protein